MPLHHLMIGTWTPPGAIFTVQFDDEALELKLVKTTGIPHDEPISWMAFDVSDGWQSVRDAVIEYYHADTAIQHAKKNLYGSAMKKWSSFAVKTPTEIVHEASHAMGSDRESSPPRHLPCQLVHRTTTGLLLTH